MGSNITLEEYTYIKTMLKRKNPTQVHRHLSRKHYRGITTIRQIQKSEDWGDYMRLYWKQTKARPQLTKSDYEAWYYSPYSPPFQVVKRKTLWDKFKGKVFK